MHILEKFNKRVLQLEPISVLQQVLQQRWQAIDAKSPYVHHSQAPQKRENNGDDTCNNLGNTGLESLLSQKRTHARLADIAAKSYWRCAKSPVKIALTCGRLPASPIKVKMAYGKLAYSPAHAEQKLVSVH